jgi:hypothetical protein
VDNLVSGIDRAQDNKSGGLDAGALLNGIAQGQGDSQKQGPKPNTGNIGGDIANEIAGGGSSSIDQIIGGLNRPGQGVAKNQSISQEEGQTRASEQNNAKEGGAALEKGQQQEVAQSNIGNGRIIQIEQTIVTEANGQQIKTEIIKDVGKPSAGPGPAQIPHQAPPADAKPTPPPAPMPGMPSEAKSTTAAAPKAEPPVQARNSTAVQEALKPTTEAQVTQLSAQRPNATVSFYVLYVLLRH